MLRFISRGMAVAACVLALALAGSARAATLTLDVLLGGATLTSDNGRLEFSFVDAHVIDLDPDLSQYSVTSLAEGIRFEGPFDSPAGPATWGQLTLTYDVTVIGVGTLDTAALEFFTAGSGAGTRGHVAEELFFGGASLGFMMGEVIFPALPGGATASRDLSALGATTLRIRKEIFVEATGAGSTASITFVDQTFPVPEPGALVLLGLGLGGLVAAGRRRR